MSSALRQRHLQVALSLPRSLRSFLRKYPPSSLLQAEHNAALQPEQVSVASDTSSANPNANTEESEPIVPSVGRHNPFQPYKNPITGRWRGPVYSLRRQAELVKLARQHGVEELLPYTVKGTEERARKREQNGLRVKGTGMGQRVKGKEWERTLKGRLEKRRQAMLKMSQMIQQWKERGHGRGWKSWPK